MTARAKLTTLRKFSSTASCHSWGVSERKFLAGGPPALVTQTSTPPNFAATASTNACTAAASVTSSGWAKTSALCLARISSAAVRRVCWLRAHMATRAPSAAKASAVARPMPWLEAATITARFRSPVSKLFRRLRRRARGRGRLDLVLLQGFLDAAAQLAPQRHATVGTHPHLHQVVHLAGDDALDDRRLRVVED